tara:strand:+ start:40 stop:891 length:852 start_codon:yes stop_codon:yes gene_type:complete
MNERFKTLVFSSGGVHGVLLLGAAKEMLKQDLLSSVTHYIGCSAGSIICGILACKIDPLTVISDYLSLDICDWNTRISPMEGLIKCAKFRRFLNNLFGDKLLKDIPYRLTFSTLNLTKKRSFYIDTNTHPNVKLVDAIMMSCSIPFLFPIMKYEHDIIVDGGIVDPFPIHKTDCPNETLGFNIEAPFYVEGNNPNSWLSISYMIYDAIMAQFRNLQDISKYNVVHIPSIKELKNILRCSSEEKVFLFHKGMNYTKTYLETYKERLNMERNDINFYENLESEIQ